MCGLREWAWGTGTLWWQKGAEGDLLSPREPTTWKRMELDVRC